MKTLPPRPANIPAPPEGYVYLGKRTDINVPPSWDQPWPASRELLDYAYYNTEHGANWKESLLTYGTNPNNYYAAKPNTPLYNLNKDRLPMNTPTHTPKTLKYEVIARESGLVAAKVIEQSHRGSDFGDHGSKFGKLESCGSPENAMYDDRKIFFVRGSGHGADNRMMLFTREQFAEFEKEVAAYNAYFSKPAILKTVFFEYSAGSVRGYRRVEVIREDETYLEGIDSKKGEYRKFLKSKIVGTVDTVKA